VDFEKLADRGKVGPQDLLADDRLVPLEEGAREGVVVRGDDSVRMDLPDRLDLGSVWLEPGVIQAARCNGLEVFAGLMLDVDLPVFRLKEFRRELFLALAPGP